MSQEHQEHFTIMPSSDQERSGYWSGNSLEIIGSLDQLSAIGDLLIAVSDADLDNTTMENLGSLIQEKAYRIKALVREKWESLKSRNRQ
jgi:hypothetical protein